MAEPQSPRARVADLRHSPFARFRPVPLDAWRVDDAFWSPWLERNRRVGLPAQWEQLEATGRLDNFRRAAAGAAAPGTGRVFDDSDLYKWLEAACWVLAAEPDPDLRDKVDAAVALVAAAQRPDGYLNTWFAGDRADERWTDLDQHELYCAGHLIEAAAAHRRATGGDALLAVARRFADHICAEFGPGRQADRPWADGHPEIELALVELARETGDTGYLEQAQTFIDIRGRGLLGRPYGRWGPAYHQDRLPLRAMEHLEGHAVRAMYLLAGATDVVLETGEPALKAALERLWLDTVTTRIYVSGGLGARHDGEAFGDAYELPNATAYAETCAAAGFVLWNARLLALTGEARYADLLEHALFNALLPGIGLDGRSWFYTNPLADHGGHRRQPWFGTACCPPNASRLLARLPGYAAAVAGDEIWLHLFLSGCVRVPLETGRTIALRVHSRYPWDGDVDLSVDTPGEFALHLRVPGWAAGARLEIGNHAADLEAEPGGYVSVRRQWAAGDTLHLSLPMAPFAVASHPALLENAGRVALRRGPLLYCLEAVDHPRAEVRSVRLPAGASLLPSWRPELLGGVTVLTADAFAPVPDPEWEGRLYRPAAAVAPERHFVHAALTAVPYFAWANRRPGPLQVWVRAD